MNQKEKNNLLWIGTIVNTHGIKGELRILSDNNDLEIKFQEKNKILYFDENNKIKELIINSMRFHKKFVLLTFNEYNNINDVEFLKGKKIYSIKEELDNEEFYLNDTIGKEVFDQNNNFVGVVHSIMNQGPYDSLIIKLDDGRTTNIPIVDEFEVNFDKKKNKVNIKIESEMLGK